MTLLAAGASPAFAAGTGGVSAASETAPASATTPATPAPPRIHLDPVTAKTPDVAYSGPVYERTATGEVIPYVAPSASTPGSSATTPGSSTTPTNPVTGGSAVAATATTTATSLTSETKPEAKPELLVPGTMARYVDGLAAAPMSAPPQIQQLIWAANQIIGLPYIYGGGHASFESPGYDCSGTVSFALHGADMLATPEDSSEFEAWGSHGAGRYITIFSNPEHAYMTVAGLRLDTSAADDPSNQQGPRWRPLRPANAGYIVRHPLGF